MKAKKSLTTIVGACLAAVAAGCLVLFSILAQNATLGVPPGGPGVKVATPDGTAPIISLPGSSEPGGDATAPSGDDDGTDETPTGPLAVLLEPLTPGELVAQLGGPDGDAPSAPPPAAPDAPAPDSGVVALVPERLDSGLRVSLDAGDRVVSAAIRTLRAQDGAPGRPSADNDGNDGPGKSNWAGHGKAAKGDKHPGRGHGAIRGGSNKGGNGHGKAKGRSSKAAKEKKSKARKAKSKGPKRSNGRGHKNNSSTSPRRSKPQTSRAPSGSAGPPGHSKSKASKPARSTTRSSRGNASGGHPGKTKGKKKS